MTTYITHPEIAHLSTEAQARIQNAADEAWLEEYAYRGIDCHPWVDWAAHAAFVDQTRIEKQRAYFESRQTPEECAKLKAWLQS